MRDLFAPAEGLAGVVVASAIVGLWAASLAAGVVLHVRLDGTVLAWIAVRTFLDVGLFITAHDAMHGSVAPAHPRLNRFIGGACLVLYAGLSFARVRRDHLEHHRLPARAGDPDWCPDPRFAPWLLAFVRRHFTARILLAHVVIVTSLWLLGAGVVDIVVLHVVPAWLSLLQLFTFGTWLPHRHGGHDEHRATSADVGVLASFLRCYHFGYHWEHHAAPHWPWWRLPSARRRRQERDG